MPGEYYPATGEYGGLWRRIGRPPNTLVGVGFIAKSNAMEDVTAGVLAEVAMADASIRRDLALVFRKDKALSRAALAFIEVAVKLKAAAASSV